MLNYFTGQPVKWFDQSLAQVRWNAAPERVIAPSAKGILKSFTGYGPRVPQDT